MAEIVDFETAYDAAHYKKMREELRPYYGERVDAFDYGDLDEYAGMLDDYTEQFGAPRSPLYFLKWVENETARQIKTLRKILQR